MPAKLSFVGVFATSSISFVSADGSGCDAGANEVIEGRGVVGVDASSRGGCSIGFDVVLIAWKSVILLTLHQGSLEGLRSGSSAAVEHGQKRTVGNDASETWSSFRHRSVLRCNQVLRLVFRS